VREEKRNCARATERGEKAWIEAAGRWTRTGYKAVLIKASGPHSAKLLWSRIRQRKSGGCSVGDEARRVRLEATDSGSALLDAMLERENMVHAWKRVKSSTDSGCPNSGHDLNHSNRRMRTRMSGGVGGLRSTMIGPDAAA
jgi:hypothetical protein